MASSPFDRCGRHEASARSIAARIGWGMAAGIVNAVREKPDFNCAGAKAQADRGAAERV
jgi:hypothetical protein